MARKNKRSGPTLARGPAPGRQRGAAAVFAAISIIAGLIAAGLAIDLGRLYFTQRDLQRLANMAALDSARIAGGCEGEVTDVGSAALGEALNSVLRNGGRSEWVINSAADIIGRMHHNAGLRVFQPLPDVSNRAVQVRVSRPAPTRLIPLLSGGGTATLNALSAAYDTPSALVQVGSRPLTISPSDAAAYNGLFPPLLGGGPISLDVLSYQALFDAKVPLGGVLDSLGQGDNADTPASLSELILAVIDQLGDPVAVAAAQNMYNAAAGSRQVVPGQLGLDDTTSGSFASAGDLLVAAAASSLDGSPISVPINLPPPLSAGSTTLRLLDPGVLARLLPGGLLASAENFAHNTSLVLQTQSPIKLAILGNTGQLNFFVQAGHSTAQVDSIQCARRGLPIDTVDVTATSSITRIGIGRFDDINSPDPQVQPVSVIDTNSTLSVLGLKLPIRVKISASAFVDLGQSDSQHFDGMRTGEIRRLGTPGTVALVNSLAAIPSNLNVTVDISLLGPVSPLIQSAVNAALASLRTSLQQTVKGAVSGALPELDRQIGPQLTALGVTIGGADVTVAGIDAEEPILFTH